VAARGDPLDAYNRRRDFSKTREPKGERGAKDGHLFVVQKHDATRLHWDFRLEMDGVLKSWAVTRGPSLDPGDKRLAVRTEDHPMSYARFEGTIPKGEYGGGTVMLWDEGTWEPVGGKDPVRTIEQGHIHVILHGQRMKGEWLLVRMKSKPGEKRENWLLRKVEDGQAGASGDLVDTALTSIATGRTMVEIAERKSLPSAPAKGKRLKGKLPGVRDVQLATLADHVPAGPGWLHEVKYDGYRALIAVSEGEARAYTRHGLDWSDRFAPIIAAFAELGLGSALLDGEVVAFDRAGRPSFSALQAALKQGGELRYFAFDLLEQDGKDITKLGNAVRKERLATLLKDARDPVHYAEHISAGGEKLFVQLCREGYEGVVSKRIDAPYRGTRTRDWLKVKCTRRQEFVIIGHVPSDRPGRDLRSLVLGLNEGGVLCYAGRVGTGFDADTRAQLLAKLKPLARKTAPAEVPRAAARGVQWVKPVLVAEIAFAEFTADHVVRHASFIGLREDKEAEEIVPETPIMPPEEISGDASFGIIITHPDRVIYPGKAITKGDLAAYYARLAEPMLQWLTDRPVSLVRCPQGRGKQCFFQKHDSGAFGDRIDHVAIREKSGDMADYIVVNDGAGLLTCVQMNTIEFHGWGARASDVEHPDRMVFDLDPEEGLDFAEVRRASIQLRDLLGEMGLVSFPMATGGKGVHVIVPLDATADWLAVKDFASRFARAVAQAYPKRFTANMRKTERRGRIFIDWLRNERGATAVLPYSARARDTATVAAPLTWSELEVLEDARPFTIADAADLAARAQRRDLGDWGATRQPLPAS
jgi:bifunctional non-homologous end joining protein LigD